MPAKLRTTRKSSKGPRDEPAAAAAETNLPDRHDRFPGPATLDPQVRHQMIACAAFFRAEQRSFAGGAESQLHDWLEAEAEIDRMLAGTPIKP
ncbi:MAG: DUF2934 domain-containing protein [Betaproteobacteria bacterium]|nr:DUF2934 domain-containing protein [Betaproteobacteria bacterium]